MLLFYLLNVADYCQITSIEFFKKSIFMIQLLRSDFILVPSNRFWYWVPMMEKSKDKKQGKKDKKDAKDKKTEKNKEKSPFIQNFEIEEHEEKPLGKNCF